MKNDLSYFANWELAEELKSRRCIMNNPEYDILDSGLYNDITEVFDSLSYADRQKLHNMVLNFKTK